MPEALPNSPRDGDQQGRPGGSPNKRPRGLAVAFGSCCTLQGREGQPAAGQNRATGDPSALAGSGIQAHSIPKDKAGSVKKVPRELPVRRFGVPLIACPQSAGDVDLLLDADTYTSPQGRHTSRPTRGKGRRVGLEPEDPGQRLSPPGPERAEKPPDEGSLASRGKNSTGIKRKRRNKRPRLRFQPCPIRALLVKGSVEASRYPPSGLRCKLTTHTLVVPFYTESQL